MLNKRLYYYLFFDASHSKLKALIIGTFRPLSDKNIVLLELKESAVKVGFGACKG